MSDLQPLDQARDDLRRQLAHLSGTQARLDWLAAHGDPEAVAAAEEIVRLSRLADYTEAPPDGLAWASYSHAAIARRTIEAVLRDVFQGKKDHLRGHMLGVAAKVDRNTAMEPHWEMRAAAQVADLKARLAALEEVLDEPDPETPTTAEAGSRALARLARARAVLHAHPST